METGAAQAKTGRKPGTFVKGDPRIKPGPGRPAMPPETREIRRRVIADLAAELKLAADLAVDRLVAIVSDPAAKDTDAIAAAAQILDRSHGRAVQAIDARLQIDECARLSADDIRRAALAVAASHAEDVP